MSDGSSNIYVVFAGIDTDISSQVAVYETSHLIIYFDYEKSYLLIVHISSYLSL